MIKDKNNNFSEEDNKLWETISNKSKKYKKTNRIILSSKPSIKKKLPKEDSKNINKRKEIFNNINNGYKKTEAKTTSSLEALDPKEIPNGISLKQAQDFKKGKVRPEKTYDLHGYTQFGAHNYLNKEIIKCYNRNIRALLIITGKKLGASGAEGVLKREVPRWLNLSPLREVVLMTSWATPRDGGDGALYVLLKRYKEINY
jgi:DNA-nicking Smr family endonuclease